MPASHSHASTIYCAVACRDFLLDALVNIATALGRRVHLEIDAA